MTECDFKGCERRAQIKRLCKAHYEQHRLGQRLKPIRIRSDSVDERLCAYRDCELPHLCHGFCAGHWGQLQKGNSLGPLHNDGCRIKDCERSYYGRGMCELHYRRWRKNGDVTHP